MTITCGIQPTGVINMAMKVLHLHNTSNICICDLPDMNALIPRACSFWALGIHIRQIPMPMLQPLHVHCYHSAKAHTLTVALECKSLMILLVMKNGFGIHIPLSLSLSNETPV